jgi:putative lipoic acid-binding regulatory protein
MIKDSENKRPQIEYPTEWEYKLIGQDVDKLLKAIEEVLPGLEYQVKFSNVSRNEKYYSLNVKVTVTSEALRDIIFQKFSNHPEVKFVI